MFTWTCSGGGTHRPISYDDPGDKCPVCQEKQEADRRVAIAEERLSQALSILEDYKTELGI